MNSANLLKMSEVFLKAAQTTSVTAAEVSAKVNPIFGVKGDAIDQNSAAAKKINEILGDYQGNLNIFVGYSKAGVASVEATTSPASPGINQAIAQAFIQPVQAAVNPKTLGLPEADLPKVHPVVDYH